MKLRYTILIAILIITVFTVVIGSFSEKTGNAIKEEQIITKSPMDMLPIREKIATEWIIQKREEYTKDVDGFNSGAYLLIDRLEGISLSEGRVYVYKFNELSNAESYYENEVKKIKEKGGYTEINPSGINAECFATKGGDYLQGHYKWVICKKHNIVFISEVGSFNSWRTSYYDDLAEIVADKI